MATTKVARAVLELATDTTAYNKGLTDAQRDAKAFEAQIDSLGKGLSSAGKSMTAWVTGPIVGVAAGLTALVMTAANAGDAIAKNAREAGLAAEPYQELSYALGQVSQMSQEQVDQAFRKLTLTIGEAAQGSKEAERALMQLGFTQAEISSGTIDTEDAFNRLNTAMQESDSQANAAALAGDLVGNKMGPKLAAALRESGGQVDVLRGQFKELGMGMSQETLDASEAFNDAMDTLKRQFTAVGGELAGQLMPLITDELIPAIREHLLPMFRTLVEYVIDGIKWFSDLSGTWKAVITGAVGLAAAIGPVLMILGPMVSAVSGLIPLVWGLSGAFTALALNPVVLGLAAVAAVAIILKTELDAGTAAMRRQIEAFNDHNTITKAFAKETDLTTEEMKEFEAALNRTHDAIYVGGKGVGTLKDLQTGLKVNLKSSNEAAIDQAVALAKLKAEALTAGATVNKLADAAGRLADTMTGKNIADEVDTISAALRIAQQRGGVTAHQMDELGRRLVTLRTQGAVLPPELARIADEFSRVHTAGLKVVRTIDSLSSVIGAVPGVAVPAKSALQKMVDEMDRIQLHGLWGKGRAEAMVAPFQWAISGLPGTVTKIGAAGEASGSAFADGFARSMEGIGNVVIGAIQGGGNVGAAIGAHLGKDLGGQLGASITKALGGKALGKMVGSFAGPLGTLLGSEIGGKLASAIGNIGKNNTKAGREEAAKLLGFGSVGDLYAKLQTMGAEGAALAHAGLNTIGKKDTAANNAWIAAVEALFQKTGEATAALATMRGELANLQAQAVPTWQQQQEAAEFLGITINKLGPAFQQQRMTEQATKIWNAWDTLAISGAVLVDHIEEMAPKLNEFVAESLKAGTKIPENFRPILQQMAESGLLLDENGEAMTDLSRIEFGEAVKSEWEIVGEAISKLEEAIDRLVKQLEGPVVNAVGGVVGAFERMPRSFNLDVGSSGSRDSGGDGLPGFSTGTPGLDFLNFGKQRRVNLHGNEAVIPRGSGHELAGEIAAGLMSTGGRGGTSRPIVIHNRTVLDGREVARSTVQHLGEQMSLAGY